MKTFSFSFFYLWPVMQTQKFFSFFTPALGGGKNGPTKIKSPSCQVFLLDVLCFKNLKSHLPSLAKGLMDLIEDYMLGHFSLT